MSAGNVPAGYADGYAAAPGHVPGGYAAAAVAAAGTAASAAAGLRPTQIAVWNDHGGPKLSLVNSMYCLCVFHLIALLALIRGHPSGWTLPLWTPPVSCAPPNY